MRIIIIIFLFINLTIYSQEKAEYLTTIDKAPRLSECLSKDKHDKNCFLATFQKYVSNRLILPFDSLNNPIEGKVKAYLIFDKNGSLQIKTVRSKNNILNKKTESLFSNFPSFEPALKNNKPISMILVYPITYIFSTDPNKFYSIHEVLPPQPKIYKTKKNPYQLNKIYTHFINEFFTKSKQQGHYTSKNTYMHSYSFEIDTLGRLGNFKDLIKPNSSYEKYYNKRALKKGKSFVIPAKIGNRAVKIRDSIHLLSVLRESRSIIRSGTERMQY